MTNQNLYQLTGQVPLREKIREQQLKFTLLYDLNFKASLISDTSKSFCGRILNQVNVTAHNIRSTELVIILIGTIFDQLSFSSKVTYIMC